MRYLPGPILLGSVMPDRTCWKCQARGHFLAQVSRYFSVDYYSCPQCGHVWVHQRHNPDCPPEDVAIRDEQDSKPLSAPLPSVLTRLHRLSIDRHVSPGSPRTQCPECGGPNILELHEVNRTSSTSDYFRCRSCGCWWLVPRGKDGPATRMILGYLNTSALTREAG